MRTFAILLASLALGGVAAAQQPIDERVSTAPTGTVEVVNTAGEVRVVGWDRPEIHVTGTLARGAERLAIDTSGDRTVIRVILPRSARDVKGTELEVRVPVRKDVTVSTTSADVAVEGVQGVVTAQSTSGDVGVAGTSARVTARSTSGDVSVKGSFGRIQAHTTSGDLRLAARARESAVAESVSGDVVVDGEILDLSAKTVSGDLQVGGVVRRLSASTVSGEASISSRNLQYLAAESVSGDLRFAGTLQRDAAVNLKSHSGEVELALPAGIGARFEVTSFSGGIRNELGPEARRAGRNGPGRELRFTSGSGEALVSVKSFSGSVRLLRR